MFTLSAPLKKAANLLSIGCVSMLLAGCPTDTEELLGIDTSNTNISIQTTSEAPSEVEDVVLSVSGIEFFPTNGDSFVIPFPEDQDISIIKIDPEVIKALFDFLLPPGSYDGIRFIVNSDPTTTNSHVSLSDGSSWPLHIDPNDLLGFLINQGFIVGDDGQHDFTLNFDLFDSLTAPVEGGSSYQFVPNLTLIDNAIAGSLRGNIDSILVTSDSCAVYLYKGHSATIDEKGSATPPYMHVPLTWDEDNSNYRYELNLLEAGQYSLAYTCQAATDTRQAIENINISSGTNVTIGDSQTTVLNFFLGTSS